MAKAFADLTAAGPAKDLPHADWLALLLDRETSWRKDKRLTARLRAAKLRQQASVEDVDYRAVRGLDRALFQKLSEGEWIDAHDNLALVGPSGVGKSWLACAIGQKACRDNRSVLYHRWPKLCEDLALARGDGRHPRLIKSLGRADLLILDDFGLEPLDAGARHDLLEIFEERYGRRATIVTSQLPLSAWHEVYLPSDCRGEGPQDLLPRGRSPPIERFPETVFPTHTQTQTGSYKNDHSCKSDSPANR
jgi:DNA replication protein DnaC